VRFSHEAVGPLSGYRDVFGCPIEFNQAYSGLLIDNEVLDVPLPQANAHLARLHEQYAAAQLQAQAQGQGLDEAVKGWLLTQLASGSRTTAPTRAEAATAFGLGERTLARRLSERGTHHHALLDQARQELAQQWLTGRERTVRDVATQLGFSELSPFYRAFQRWTGCTPRAWSTRHRSAD
jgi:AraC-like DNA-binding protein